MRKADPRRWTGRILLGLFFVLLALAWWTSMPFLPAILVAAFLVAVLQRPHQWLLAKLGNRRKTAALLATAATTLVLLAPITGFFIALGAEIPTAVDSVQKFLGPEGIQSLPRKVPARYRPFVANLLQTTKPGGQSGQSGQAQPQKSSSTEHVSKAMSAVAPHAATALMRVFDYMILTLVLVISLFYLFLDGRSLVAWTLWILPLRPRYTRELLEEFWRVAYAMIWGTAAIALGQGICGGFIFFVLGVPAPLLLALAMAFASFIPAVGTALVWVPVAAWLAFSDGVTKSVILVAYCLVVIVVFVDHLLRPLVVKDKMTMHPLLAFVAMFGGIIAFGLIGLLAGPLIMAGLVTVLRIYGRDLGPHADNEAGDVPAHEVPQEPAGALPELQRQQH